MDQLTEPKRARAAKLAAAAFCLSAPLLLSLGGGFADPPQDTAPYPRKGRYVGKEVCIGCHEDEAGRIARGVHAPVVTSPATMGCETCHGPGHAHTVQEDHAAGLITFPPELAAKDQRGLCGRCHQEQIDGHGGDMRGFLAAGFGCTECHGVHSARAGEKHPGVHFATRAAADAGAEPVPSARCARCHPLQQAALLESPHRSLAAGHAELGCVGCHGNGSLHVETDGLGRLITRPDRARDGVATCRSCHAEVDAEEFHWKDRRDPLLTKGIRCTTCHEVHGEQARAPAAESGQVDPQTGERQDRAADAGEPTNRLCVKCHAPGFEVLKGTIHETLGAPDLPLSIGCGACHPGAQEHAKTPGRKDLVESMHDSKAGLQRAICTKCHATDPALRFVDVGSHHRSEVSCLWCHSATSPKGRMREDAERNCAKCHQHVAAQFAQPNHHPVPEGHMLCSDCHEPHGARPKVRDLELNERRCLECHKQYRGPFVFAHQASRTDGCVACHTPHGTSNRRLLQQANPQQNCLQCHGDFPAFHDQTPGAVFTNCLNCHTQVHGSNFSRYLFR